MIVLLVRGVRGDCSGPSDGNCARISEEREEREDRTPHSALCSAPCPRPRVPVLGYHSRPGTLTLQCTGHDHSYEHRGPGQAAVPRLGVNSSVLQILH